MQKAYEQNIGGFDMLDIRVHLLGLWEDTCDGAFTDVAADQAN